MPPDLALLIWFVLLVFLLYFDPAKERNVSSALWVPVIWTFFLASRLPSQWFGVQVSSAADALEEGNPIDRTVLSILILTALLVLLSRRLPWNSLASRNVTLVTFLAYAMLSVCWSDFPLIALKRWFRDLGDYAMVVVVLTDPHPLEAFRTFFRRLAYMLVPLCIVLDKYFPIVSKQYDSWTGVGTYAGATTGKNLLGLLAMLSALFFLWDTTTHWANRRARRTKQVLAVNLAFFVMSVSLVRTAESATCRVCLLLGSLVILAANSRLFRRNPLVLQILIPISFCLYVLLALGMGMSADLAAAVGKDPTLTERTRIWSIVLGMKTNPLFGTGYESFWLGRRLEYFWANSGLGRINEAHNGYLEVYLNLGIIGLLILAAFLLAGYRKICRGFNLGSSLGSFHMAIWVVMLFFCVTEAGFRSGLMWITVLLATVAVPARAEHAVSDTQAVTDVISRKGRLEVIS